MPKKELKNKCTERAKIFQHAMECCKSSNPMDCIEWFADRIVEFKKENAELKENYYVNRCLHSDCPYLHIDNRNCTKFGSFFTSVSNKDCPMMKNLNANIELTKAKEIIKKLYDCLLQDDSDEETRHYIIEYMTEAENFLKEE